MANPTFKRIAGGIGVGMFLGGIGYFGLVYGPAELRAKQSELRNSLRPVSAYYLDINGDGKLDVVLRSVEGTKTIFLQDAESGRYNLLEDVVKTERGLYEGRIEDMTRSVDDKIKNFEAEHKVK